MSIHRSIALRRPAIVLAAVCVLVTSRAGAEDFRAFDYRVMEMPAVSPTARALGAAGQEGVYGFALGNREINILTYPEVENALRSKLNPRKPEIEYPVGPNVGPWCIYHPACLGPPDPQR